MPGTEQCYMNVTYYYPFIVWKKNAKYSKLG